MLSNGTCAPAINPQWPPFVHCYPNVNPALHCSFSSRAPWHVCYPQAPDNAGVFAARIAATVLTRAAIDRGSRDNVTVVVIDLAGIDDTPDAERRSGPDSDTGNPSNDSGDT